MSSVRTRQGVFKMNLMLNKFKNKKIIKNIKVYFIMTFSIGQNFYKDLLESSDKRTQNGQMAIIQTVELQQRLNDFWKNNDKPVLLNSQKYAGMTNVVGDSEPLGGSINWTLCGIKNVPGSCKDGCPYEYPFWGTTVGKNPEKKENFENINEVVEQPEIIEKFTMDDIIVQKENFSGDTRMILYIVLIVVFVLGLGGYLFFIRDKL